MNGAGGQLTNQQRREIRSDLVRLIRSDLIGPTDPAEILRERPDKRYLMGMLFPREALARQVVSDEETAGGDTGEQEAGDEDIADDEGYESPTDLMFQRLPASVGVSFAIDEGEKLALD